MPPFLVPIADVARTQRGATGTTEAAVLLRSSDDPGGPPKQQHCTSNHRIECLARSHPLVLSVGPYKPGKALGSSAYNSSDRALRYRQSPHDLRLTVGSGMGMPAGCSVNGARQGLQSVWWGTAPGCELTREQESLARAVF